MSELLDVLDEKGNYLDIQKERNDIHAQGLWHRAIAVFVVNNNGQVLLQKRSAYKKFWPNMWDVSIGGHTDANEFGYQTAVREAQEELGIKLVPQDLTYIGCTRSQSHHDGIIDNMFNEYFVIFSDLDPATLKLQLEEVCQTKFVSPSELKDMMDDGYKILTPKKEAFELILRFLKTLKK